MTSDSLSGIPIMRKPLGVSIVDGEIVLDCSGTSAPSLTAEAARETAKLLMAAADTLQGVGPTDPHCT